mmetsp:Transcript_27738/g.90291  ORF Transcript_27738/g.90291 Transcript_27738/m.90291 type:complete len:334 (-) Transcript_27738:75-1076(-)
MMARRYEAGKKGMLVAGAMAMTLCLLLLVLSPRRQSSELLASKQASGKHSGLGKKNPQLLENVMKQSYSPSDVKPRAHQPASLNVPYFSKFVHPEPHYRKGGMHSAAMHWKDANGIVEDRKESKKLIQAKQAQALSTELSHTMDEYLKDENHGISWTVRNSQPQYAEMQAKKRQHSLSPAKAEALAKELTQTQQNYFDPAASAPKTHEKFVSKQAGEALAKSLEAGEEAALRPHKLNKLHQAVKVNAMAGKKLAAELNAGEADALAIVAKNAINQEIEDERRKNLNHIQTFSKDLGPSLSRKQSEELVKDLDTPMNVVNHKVMHPTTHKVKRM